MGSKSFEHFEAFSNHLHDCSSFISAFTKWPNLDFISQERYILHHSKIKALKIKITVNYINIITSPDILILLALASSPRMGSRSAYVILSISSIDSASFSRRYLPVSIFVCGCANAVMSNMLLCGGVTKLHKISNGELINSYL